MAQSLQQRPTWVRYFVLAWLCLAATIAYVQRNSISVAESTIRAELDLSKQEMSFVITAFFIGYSVFQLPAGWLGHVLGSRRGLALFSAVWSGVTGLMALGGGAVGLSSVRLGMGAAQAGVFPCAAGSIARWFPTLRRSLASGALGSFMSVGGAVGAMITAYLLASVGWRWMYVLYALPGLLWAIGFWFWFRDRPGDHGSVNAAELALIEEKQPGQETDAGREPETPEPTPWREILTSATLWWIGGQQFCRAAGYIFFASWFATYLQETRHVDVTEAGLLNSLPLWAVVAGSLIGGAVSDWVLARTGSRRLARQGLAAVSMLACAGLTAAAYFIADTTAAVLAISAGSFLAAFAGPCAYTITIDLGGRHVAMVFSFMNLCGNVGAVAFPLAVPQLLKLPGGWDLVLFVFAGLYVAAALCWLCFDADKPVLGRKRYRTANHGTTHKPVRIQRMDKLD